jgi:hypothetical protein
MTTPPLKQVPPIPAKDFHAKSPKCAVCGKSYRCENCGAPHQHCECGKVSLFDQPAEAK